MKKCLILFVFLSFFLLAYCPLSKAYTYDEFRSFVSNIYDQNIGSSDLRSAMYKFLNSDTQIKSCFSSNNLNISNYNNWLLLGTNQYNWSLWFYNGTVPDYQVWNNNLFSSITFARLNSFSL